MRKFNSWKTILFSCVFCAVTANASPAQTFNSLLSFNGTDGQDPNHNGVVQGTDGNFYGTVASGGNTACVQGCGTVFKITPGGALTTLHKFDGGDGSYPGGGLVLATTGNFYGATGRGGAHSDGTIFSLSVGLGPFVETLPTSGKVGTAVIILGNSLTDTTSVNLPQHGGCVHGCFEYRNQDHGTERRDNGQSQSDDA